MWFVVQSDESHHGIGCYTKDMPTRLDRTYVTHTRPIQAALETARALYPNDSPSVLMNKLIVEGGESLKARSHNDTEKLRNARAAAAGQYTGMFPPGFIDEIREGWPE